MTHWSLRVEIARWLLVGAFWALVALVAFGVWMMFLCPTSGSCPPT
jgi:hypothetical protein